MHILCDNFNYLKINIKGNIIKEIILQFFKDLFISHEWNYPFREYIINPNYTSILIITFKRD